jgi:hypothetical protein
MPKARLVGSALGEPAARLTGGILPPGVGAPRARLGLGLRPRLLTPGVGGAAAIYGPRLVIDAWGSGEGGSARLGCGVGGVVRPARQYDSTIAVAEHAIGTLAESRRAVRRGTGPSPLVDVVKIALALHRPPFAEDPVGASSLAVFGRVRLGLSVSGLTPDRQASIAVHPARLVRTAWWWPAI